MRLIDADELMKAMYHRAFETDGDTMWQSGCWVRYRAIEQTVKAQPTIERETGEWLHDLLQDAIDAGIITETQASRLMDRIAEDNT